MNRIQTGLALVALTFFPMLSHADEFTIGSVGADGSIFFYEEPVETYSNDWSAYPLMARESLPSAGTVRLTVIGTGKTLYDFVGNLTIYCWNGEHTWESAGDSSGFFTKEKVDEYVSSTVISNAISVFCKKP